MEANAKPGVKTSEFWITAGTNIIALLVLGGIFNQADQAGVDAKWGDLVAGVFSAITNMSYIISRTSLKGRAQ